MINYIGKTQIKKWLLEDLKPFLKVYGFKINPSVNVDIIRDGEKIFLDAFMTVNSTDNISFRTAFITYKPVELILFNITNLPVYDGGSKTLKIFPDEQYGSLATIAKNRDDVMIIASSFKQVFIECFLPAFEKYSDPKNVLELWDSLETMAEKGLVFQDSHNYSKIIILSKMCNDEIYQRRIDETIAFFQSEINKGEDWVQTKLDVFLKVIQYLEANEI